jgi:pimeloyl-ACP methyl ester carboxylesterase
MVILTILAVILIGALLVVSAMVGGVWWYQERIAYQPPRDRPSPPSGVRRIEYIAADGEQLLGYVVEPDVEPAGVLVAFHGNADLATWQVPWAREVARRTRWCVFLAEYRGYGGLDGMPTYVGLRHDARASWDAARRFACERFAAPTFALFGHSLGSGVAAELAAEIEADRARSGGKRGTSPRLSESLAALVVQSPFTSARDMARIVSTRPVQLLWRLISRVHYDTRERVTDITAPVWIAHGARDWLVPVWMGRDLFARSRRPGRLLIVEQAGHNDVAVAGGEAYWRWLSDALSGARADLHGVTSTRRTEIQD